jgi:hypothetical protein
LNRPIYFTKQGPLFTTGNMRVGVCTYRLIEGRIQIQKRVECSNARIFMAILESTSFLNNGPPCCLRQVEHRGFRPRVHGPCVGSATFRAQAEFETRVLSLFESSIKASLLPPTRHVTTTCGARPRPVASQCRIK